MLETIINLHIHTTHSDGTGTHQDIANAAYLAGLDAVMVTDHNTLVKDAEGYYSVNGRSMLVLVGEEIHDTKRIPQKNHLLAFGIDQELADYAHDPQELIDMIDSQNGLSFLAHPTDPAAPLFNQSDFSWVNWEITGFTGIELWNAFSEFKTRLGSKLEAIWYAFQPKRIARGPLQPTLEIWDQLTSKGQKIVAVGGSDAHAMEGKLGPLRRTLFPYRFHFNAINTHLLISEQLTGELKRDKELIYNALRNGHCFIGYDLPYPTRGFRFSGSGKAGTASMGDEIELGDGIDIIASLPRRADCVLLKDGKVVNSWKGRDDISYRASEPGVYRMEVYLNYKGKQRGWIFSNPLYIR